MTGATDDSHRAWEEMAVGFALHALEPDEEAEFATHLGGCDRCARAVGEANETAARLGYAAPPEQPSSDLRARLQASVGAAPLAHLPTPTGNRLRRPVLLAAAASVVVLAGAGATVGLLSSGSTTQTPQALVQCLEDVTCRHLPLVTTTTGRTVGSVLIRHGDVWVVTDGLARNDTTSQIYVLWQTPPNAAAVAVATFDVRRSGPAVVGGVRLPAGYSATERFAVTREAGRTAPPKPSTPLAVTRAA